MISNALRVIRQYHSLNQTQLAAKLSISTSYLSEIESGKKEVTLDILQRYSNVFDVPLSSLVVFSETLAGDHKISKARSFVSKKMLKIMEWIAGRNEQSSAKDHSTI